MRLPEKLPLYAKWVVVWLVLLPMILNRVEHSGAFASAWVCALVVGVGFGLCVPLVDEMFLFFCQPRKKQKSHAAYILTFSTCQHDFTHENEKLKRGGCMRRNSSSLHLKIAEWILERDEAVSVYDVMAKFGITRHQAMGHLSILERDDAIKMQKNDTIINSHCRHTIKTVTITYIDRKKIAQRKRSPNYHHYKSHPVKSVSDLPPSEKWEWLIKNSRRRKV